MNKPKFSVATNIRFPHLRRPFSLLLVASNAPFYITTMRRTSATKTWSIDHYSTGTRPTHLFDDLLFHFLRDTLTPRSLKGPMVSDPSSATYLPQQVISRPPPPPPRIPAPKGLIKSASYWKIRTTRAKARWFDRELLDVVSEEFNSRSRVYYKKAIKAGFMTLNNQIVRPETVVRPIHRLEHVTHWHEPPITSAPIKILQENLEHQGGYLVIEKPGGMPVHATGRYLHHSLIHLLKHEHGYWNAIAVNRLDHLTSGLMVIPLSTELAGKLMYEFKSGTVKKEYVARVNGKFPSAELMIDDAILVNHMQMGKNRIHQGGKPAKTIFNRIRYDENTDSSVVHCQPITGRTHQIRVHLQHLGYSIVNDRAYSKENHRQWGDLAISSISSGDPNISISDKSKFMAQSENLPDTEDYDEYTAYQSLIARAKSLLPQPKHLPPHIQSPKLLPASPLPTQRQLTLEEALERLSLSPSIALEFQPDRFEPSETHVSCPKCCLSLSPDPKPHELNIFLHALRYTTSLGHFETEMPVWTKEGFVW